MKLKSIYIIRRDSSWLIVGLGHPYDFEGEVYLWDDGIWSSEPKGAGYPTKEYAVAALKKYGYKES